MKKPMKLIMLLLGMMIIVSLTACDNTKKGEGASTAVAKNGKEDKTGQSNMGNPWMTASSADAAARGAGIDSFKVPDGKKISLGEIKTREYRCMNGIAEAYIPMQDVILTIRKGRVSEAQEEGDISGDYNEYKHKRTQKVDKTDITCYGDQEEIISKAIWTDNRYCYSIVSHAKKGKDNVGLTSADLKELVKGMQ